MLTTLLTALIGITPQEFIDGSEIGDATAFVAFESHGKYHAERIDKAKGNTVLKGAWTMKGDTVEAKPASCAGPACKELNKPYKADVIAAAERAMLVKSTPPDSMFPSGSYYCHYLGCEKRTGVELLSKGAKAMVVTHVLDTLIDKNRGRNVTVVWWGKKLLTDAGKSRIEFCPREPERSKPGAEQVAADLAELPWIGTLEITPSAEKDCLWDVRVYLADDVSAPAKVH